MTTKDTGEISEQVITARLMQKEYTVLQPVGENHAYDLVVDDEGEFIRAQCKTAWKNGGVITFNSHRKRFNQKRQERYGYDGEIDMFYAYSPDRDSVYEIPAEDAIEQAEFSIRYEEPELSSPNINWEEDYLLDAAN